MSAIKGGKSSEVKLAQDKNSSRAHCEHENCSYPLFHFPFIAALRRFPPASARTSLQRRLSSGFPPGPHGACGFHRTPRSIVGREPNDLRPSLRSHYRSIAGSTSAFQHRSSSLLFFACFVPSWRRHADTFPCSNDSIYACTLLGPGYEPAGLDTSRRSSPMTSLFSGPC